jgi:hypothetical protein
MCAGVLAQNLRMAVDDYGACLPGLVNEPAAPGCGKGRIGLA